MDRNIFDIKSDRHPKRLKVRSLFFACFVAGTEILTPSGEVSIEDIEVGDWVIADDPTTPGEIEKRQVLQTFVRETDTLVDLHVDGELISTTEEHPFWVVDQGWVEADDLRIGDLLITEDGVIIDIDRIEKREGEFEVYNFEVEDFHTYFVSDLEILVHNADCGDVARIKLNKKGNAKLPKGHEYKLTPDEKAFAEDFLKRHPQYHLYRTNQKGGAGDFLVVDMSGGNPRNRDGFVFDVKKGHLLQEGGGGAGNQLRNAPQAAAKAGLTGNMRKVTGDGKEFVDKLSGRNLNVD